MQEIRNHFITTNRPYTEGAVYLFEQEFESAPAVKAELIITALGVYEAQINGRKAGDQMFAPGYTYYHKDLFYQRHDLTGLLKDGKNRLSVYLGQGWYCGRFTHENKTQIYGEQAAVSWILELEYGDGEKRKITSSDSGILEKDSPYEYAGFYDGEIYYAGLDDSVSGQIVKYEGKIPENIQLTENYVKVQEEVSVQGVIRNGNETILDFGCNFAGIIEIKPGISG